SSSRRRRCRYREPQACAALPVSLARLTARPGKCRVFASYQVEAEAAMGVADDGVSFDFPYPSRRMPVLAWNCVATTQPLAAQAGLTMLAKSGNAVDAAIATAITLTVVEPTGNGLGSDLFAIVSDGEKLHGLNASGRSPAGWTPDRFEGPA